MQCGDDFDTSGRCKCQPPASVIRGVWHNVPDGTITMPLARYDELLARVEKYEGALWSLMKWSGYPEYPRGSHEYTALHHAGLAIATGSGWTQAAHDFASRMQQENGGGK